MSSFFSLPFQPPSEEEKAQMEHEQRTAEVKMDEFRHGFQRLFEELDEDQLRSLRQMLHFIVDGTGSVLAANWEGMVSQAMKNRFNICVTCGVDHDKEIHFSPSDAPEPKLKETEDGQVYFERQAADEPLPGFGELTPEDKENMKKWHLDDVRIEGTNELVGFACTGVLGMNRPCGVVYQSIEDRMLRDPESCSGCFSRMGHG